MSSTLGSVCVPRNMSVINLHWSKSVAISRKLACFLEDSTDFEISVRGHFMDSCETRLICFTLVLEKHPAKIGPHGTTMYPSVLQVVQNSIRTCHFMNIFVPHSWILNMSSILLDKSTMDCLYVNRNNNVRITDES